MAFVLLPTRHLGPGQSGHRVYWRTPSGTEEFRCLILESNQPQTEELRRGQFFLRTPLLPSILNPEQHRSPAGHLSLTLLALNRKQLSSAVARRNVKSFIQKSSFVSN